MLIMFLGLCLDGLDISGALLYIFVWLIFATFFASLGVWFSTVSRSTLRATMATLVTSVMVLFGHWIVSGICIFLPLSAILNWSDRRDVVEWLTAMELGVTPPMHLAMAPMRNTDEIGDIDEDAYKILFFGIGGLAAFFVFGQLIRWASIQAFSWRMSRQNIRRPEVPELVRSSNQETPGRTSTSLDAVVVAEADEDDSDPTLLPRASHDDPTT